MGDNSTESMHARELLSDVAMDARRVLGPSTYLAWLIEQLSEELAEKVRKYCQDHNHDLRKEPDRLARRKAKALMDKPFYRRQFAKEYDELRLRGVSRSAAENAATKLLFNALYKPLYEKELLKSQGSSARKAVMGSWASRVWAQTWRIYLEDPFD
jgi:hypothetical protein